MGGPGLLNSRAGVVTRHLAIRMENAERMAASLQAENARLREQVRASVARGYEAGYGDGYRAGAADALDPMSPDHSKALASAAS